METQATQVSKSPHPLVWIAAIALIVFCAAGVAALMGWIPTSLGKVEQPALSQLDPAKASEPPATPAQLYAAPTAPVHTERARDERARMSRNLPPPATAAVRCAECGVIQSVREIDVKGEGSGVGVVGGAVVGGLLGNQVGGGDGKKVMTVVGAVGGAVAGNEIEKRVKTTKSYEVTVRLDDGSSRVFTETTAPAWRSGDKVKVINGAIQSNT